MREPTPYTSRFRSRVGIDVVSRRLVDDLRPDLEDGQLVELARQDDRRVVEPGGVEHRRRPDRQVRQVTGVETDADRAMPGGTQLLEHLDRVGDTRLEGVDGVHQQQTLVGIDLGVRPEMLPAHHRPPP